MKLYLNDKMVGTFDIVDKAFITTKTIELMPGVNIIKFHSLQGCDIPWKVKDDSRDPRCLSFNIGNFHRVGLETPDEDLTKYLIK